MKNRLGILLSGEIIDHVLILLFGYSRLEKQIVLLVLFSMLIISWFRACYKQQVFWITCIVTVSHQKKPLQFIRALSAFSQYYWVTSLSGWGVTSLSDWGVSSLSDWDTPQSLSEVRCLHLPTRFKAWHRLQIPEEFPNTDSIFINFVIETHPCLLVLVAE